MDLFDFIKAFFSALNEAAKFAEFILRIKAKIKSKKDPSGSLATSDESKANDDKSSL